MGMRTAATRPVLVRPLKPRVAKLFPDLSLHLRCYWVHALPRKATERTDTQHGTETTGATATRRGRHDLALHQESIIAILKSEKFNKLKKKEQTQKPNKKWLLGHWQTQRIGKNASQNRILGINWHQITTRKNFILTRTLAKTQRRNRILGIHWPQNDDMNINFILTKSFFLGNIDKLENFLQKATKKLHILKIWQRK
jgi:hypothetical protein